MSSFSYPAVRASRVFMTLSASPDVLVETYSAGSPGVDLEFTRSMGRRSQACVTGGDL